MRLDGIDVSSPPIRKQTPFTIADALPIRVPGTDSPATVKPSIMTPEKSPTANISVIAAPLLWSGR